MVSMPSSIIRLYRIANCKYIDDLSGEGAYRVGGRWNSKGTRLLYTSTSISLSMLEVIVHSDGLPIHRDMCLVTISIPENRIEWLADEDLPTDWADLPSSQNSKNIGDHLIEKREILALSVPSVLIPEERNILINPLHSDFNSLNQISQRKIRFDARFP